jgi:hypothetical protein
MRKYLLGGVPVGSPTSTGHFMWCVCDVCVMCVWSVCVLPKKKATGDEYSILQTSTKARLSRGMEYKQLSMCTLSVHNRSARPKPGTPTTLQGCNFFGIFDFLASIYICIGSFYFFFHMDKIVPINLWHFQHNIEIFSVTDIFYPMTEMLQK